MSKFPNFKKTQNYLFAGVSSLAVIAVPTVPIWAQERIVVGPNRAAIVNPGSYVVENPAGDNFVSGKDQPRFVDYNPTSSGEWTITNNANGVDLPLRISSRMD